MAYEAPTLTEVGSIESLTLGQWAPGPQRDTSSWWGRWDIFGDPAPGS